MSNTEDGPETIKVEGPDKREFEVWFFKKISVMPPEGPNVDNLLFDVTARVMDALSNEKQFDVVTQVLENDVDHVWNGVADKARELVESGKWHKNDVYLVGAEHRETSSPPIL